MVFKHQILAELHRYLPHMIGLEADGVCYAVQNGFR